MTYRLFMMNPFYFVLFHFIPKGFVLYQIDYYTHLMSEQAYDCLAPCCKPPMDVLEFATRLREL